jgi:peptide subunit release factor 1 (eRF1)
MSDKILRTEYTGNDSITIEQFEIPYYPNVTHTEYFVDHWKNGKDCIHTSVFKTLGLANDYVDELIKGIRNTPDPDLIQARHELQIAYDKLQGRNNYRCPCCHEEFEHADHGTQGNEWWRPTCPNCEYSPLETIK